MKALFMTSPGTISLQEVPVPARVGECLVRVTMAGICGTDLQILEGYAEFGGIPGHEFTGVVEAAPEADRAWLGKRVVGEINVGCGTCDWCRRNEKEHCAHRSVVGIRQRDGAFAEYVTLPSANLHEIPDAVDDETAVFVEPTAAACRILEQMSIPPHARVAVIGDGRMGLLVSQVIRTVAPAVTVLGRHREKLAVAAALGLAAVRSDATIQPADRFDVVVDVTGRPEGLTRALSVVRPRGTVVMKSTFHGEAPMESWPIVVDEVTLLGSRCGPFTPAIALLSAGTVQVKPLIARVAPLEDFASAFAEARTALKVLFTHG
jgi:alcohol dehydrogenase